MAESTEVQPEILSVTVKTYLVVPVIGATIGLARVESLRFVLGVQA